MWNWKIENAQFLDWNQLAIEAHARVYHQIVLKGLRALASIASYFQFYTESTKIVCRRLLINIVSFFKYRWFKEDINPYTGQMDWLFTGTYWNRDWKMCPDIF